LYYFIDFSHRAHKWGPVSESKNCVSERRQTQPELYDLEVILSENGLFWKDMNTGSSPDASPEITVSDSNNTGITVSSEVNGFWLGLRVVLEKTSW